MSKKGSCSSLQSLEDSLPESPTSKRRILQNQTPSTALYYKLLKVHMKHPLVVMNVTTSASPYKEELVNKKHYVSVKKRSLVRDVKFDNNCNIVLTTKSTVQLYDNNGVFKEKLFGNRVTEPWGIFIRPDNSNVLVSDHAEHCVKEFNSLGIVVEEFGVVQSPTGVAVSSAGYVFVSSLSEGCIYVFDDQGLLATCLGKDILNKPTHITFDKSCVLVADQNRVVGLTLKNEVSFVFKLSDQIDRPPCLITDQYTGYALATNFYRDQVIGLDQANRKLIKLKHSKTPTLCAISPYRHLLIGEEDQTGTVLKMFRIK